MGFSPDIFSWPLACVISLPLAITNDTSIQRFPQYEDFILAKGYCRRLISRYGFSRARVAANLKVEIIADASREGRREKWQGAGTVDTNNYVSQRASCAVQHAQ